MIARFLCIDRDKSSMYQKNFFLSQLENPEKRKTMLHQNRLIT